MSETSKSKGTEAEDQAAKFLLSLGYTLITRRFKTRHGEIDIVALDGETIVFVEVKYRSGGLVSPEESVTDLKSSRFQAAVEEYFSKADQPEMPARYDLIAIDQTGLRHHKNAIY